MKTRTKTNNQPQPRYWHRLHIEYLLYQSPTGNPLARATIMFSTTRFYLWSIESKAAELALVLDKTYHRSSLRAADHIPIGFKRWWHMFNYHQRLVIACSYKQFKPDISKLTHVTVKCDNSSFDLWVLESKPVSLKDILNKLLHRYGLRAASKIPIGFKRWAYKHNIMCLK